MRNQDRPALVEIRFVRQRGEYRSSQGARNAARGGFQGFVTQAGELAGVRA